MRTQISKQSTLFLSMLIVLFICVPLHAKEKIIIDADVGIDDAMAILLASASPELDLIGITTTFGNATIENSTNNALYLLARQGLSIPVAKGAAIPLVIPPEPPTDFVHGKNGLGDVPVPKQSTELLSPLSAAEFIIAQSKRYAGELTLVPIGRLTNLALALKLDPTLPQRIKRVVLMGGAFEVNGNVTPVAEANIIGDPHAADIVFQADWDVVAIGLDVTTKIIVSDQDLTTLANRNRIAGGFIRDFSQFYLDFYRSVGITEGFYVHDPATLLYLIQPTLFSTQKAAIRVATTGIGIGQTIAAKSLQSKRGAWQGIKFNAYANQVESEQAKALFLSRLDAVKFVN